jgi:hypothetical protein
MLFSYVALQMVIFIEKQVEYTFHVLTATGWQFICQPVAN